MATTLDDLDDACCCGHVLDEHHDTFLQECAIDGCGCQAYDPLA